MDTSKLFSPETTVRRDESKFLASAIGEEVVIMNMDRGDYLGVNSVGADIWNLLEKPRQVKAIVSDMLKMYDVEEGQCAIEVENFLDKMYAQDLLVIEQQ